MNKLITAIMTHTNFMDRALKMSVEIYEHSIEGDVEKVNISMEAREKLISILQKLQEIVSINLNNLSMKEKVEAQDIITSWNHDLSEWIQVVSEIDDEVVNLLNQHKEKTTEEISSIFENHRKFKGYNLKNVK